MLRRNKRKCKGLGSGSGDGTPGYVRSDAQGGEPESTILNEF